MFKSLVDNTYKRLRPATASAASQSTPHMVLPFAAIMVDGNNYPHIKMLHQKGTALTAEDVGRLANTSTPYHIFGEPFSAYDGKAAEGGVAQYWERTGSNAPAAEAILVRVKPDGFLIQARQGGFFAILHKGDPQRQWNAAMLVCVSSNGQSQFLRSGDQKVFAGAAFFTPHKAAQQFQHVRDHIARTCQCGATPLKLG